MTANVLVDMCYDVMAKSYDSQDARNSTTQVFPGDTFISQLYFSLKILFKFFSKLCGIQFIHILHILCVFIRARENIKG